MSADGLDANSPLGQLRFRHLRFLYTLGRTRNLHRTAEEMNITQPAATKMLQEIERLLDLELFAREGRGLIENQITPFVVNFAEQSLRELTRFEKNLNAMREGGFGVLSIGALMVTVPDMLPKALAELKRRRPMLAVEISTFTSDRLLRMLEKRELDLVIGRLTEQRHRAMFEVQEIGLEQLCVFVSSQHPILKDRKFKLEKIMDYTWVVQQKSSPMRQIIDGIFADTDASPLVNTIETSSISVTLNLVKKSMMVAVLPQSMIQEEIDQGWIVTLPIPIKNPLTRYGIIRRRGEYLSESAEEFASIILDQNKIRN